MLLRRKRPTRPRERKQRMIFLLFLSFAQVCYGAASAASGEQRNCSASSWLTERQQTEELARDVFGWSDNSTITDASCVYVIVDSHEIETEALVNLTVHGDKEVSWQLARLTCSADGDLANVSAGGEEVASFDTAECYECVHGGPCLGKPLSHC